jgi:hypothetical protein
VRLFPRLFVVLLVASAVSAYSSARLASASTAPSCAPTQATLSATASKTVYARGVPVVVTVALHNHTASACSFVSGPFSPNFLLKNSSGTTVWGSCWFGGGPAPCPMYLRQRVLAPGATYRDRLTWNQRTGHPDLLVPVGQYRFSVTMSGLVQRAAASFRLGTS